MTTVGEPDAASELAEADLDATAGRLASVRLLLNSERNVAEHDLLLATVFEYLESGPKSTQELVRRLEVIWPGVPVSRHALDGALEAAQSAGYVAVEQTITSRGTWVLAERGRTDLASSRSWASDVLTRAGHEVHRQAQTDLGEDDLDAALRWRDLLVEAIDCGLRDAFVSNPDGVDVVSEQFIFPSVIDLKVVDEYLEERCSADHVCEFLRALVRLAVDPSQVFGTEVVHALTTGYVMRSFAAGFDNAEARRQVGPMTDEVLFLDTPVLLQLGGPLATAEPAWKILAQARKHGVRVVVAEQTQAELDRVIAARETEALLAEADLVKGVLEPEHLRASVRDGVLDLWLSCEPNGSDGWLSWAEFTARMMQVPSTVQAIGGEISFDIEGLDLIDRRPFESAIRTSLDERGSGRGDAALEHDADLLRLIHAARCANPPSSQKVWPGAIALSSDSHLVGSYRAAVGTEPDSIQPSMTIGQWGALLAKCCPPADVEELASAVGADVNFRSTLTRGVAVPIETAIEIARSLKGVDASAAALETIQLSLDDIIASQPDLAASAEGASSLAGLVLAKRHSALERVASEQREATRTASERAEKHRLVKEAELRTTADVAARENRRLQERSERAEEGERRASTQLESERAENAKRLRRLSVAAVGCFALILAVVVAGIQGWVGARGIVVVGIVIALTVAGAIEWVTNLKTPWWRIALGLAVAAGWLALELILGSSS